MNYKQYQKDLHRIHKSEIYGAAVFDAAQRITWSQAKKAKWQLLYELEVQTLALFLKHMEESGQPLIEPSGWRLRGYLKGIVLGVLPWRFAMRLLADGTETYQRTFARLKKNSLAEHRTIFEYV